MIPATIRSNPSVKAEGISKKTGNPYRIVSCFIEFSDPKSGQPQFAEYNCRNGEEHSLKSGMACNLVAEPYVRDGKINVGLSVQPAPAK